MGYFSKALDILPSAIVSRAFGAIADLELPTPVQKCINKSFVKLAGLDMSESDQPADRYSSLSALFTRPLKDGSRTIAESDLISPVDGRLSFAGEINNETLVEAKGQNYSVPKLTGTENPEHLSWLKNSYAFTIYLAPYNYHRIHAPLSGQITDMAYVPGRLLPVNKLGYLLTDDLLPANERLTTFISRADGHRCALVKVGATCVGKISVQYDDFSSNSSLFRNRFERKITETQSVYAGDQIACFDLGSTVVLFVDRNGFTPNPNLKLGDPIKMGTSLGNWE